MGGFLGIGGGASFNTNPAQGYIDSLRNLGTSFGSDFNLANAQYGGINKSYLDALGSYSDYLKTNPATNQFNATQIANAEGGSSEAAQRAKANTSADLASRGISMKSGIGAGSLAGIDTALAANDINTQNANAQANIERNARNQAGLANLWTGAQNAAFGQRAQTGSEAQSADQDLFGDALGLSKTQHDSDLASQNAPLSLISGIGNWFGTGGISGLWKGAGNKGNSGGASTG